MNVAFVTIEDVSSGLFRTQVLEPATYLSSKYENINITIYAINRIWKFRDGKAAINRISNAVDSRVEIRIVPALPPLRHLVGSVFLSELFTYYLSFVFRVSIRKDYDLIQARSYWPLMALIRSGHSTLVFDPRSLWPLENVSAGNIKNDSSVHKYWLEQEQKCLENSYVTLAISQSMKDYYATTAPDASVELVPICYSEDLFYFDPTLGSIKRSDLNWENNLVFVYSGSLGLSGINTDSLTRLFSQVLRLGGSRLLMLTTVNPELIESLFTDVDIEQFQYRVVRSSTEDMSAWLSACDIGLHALPEQLDSDTRLGTKIVEYWAVGLPCLINNNVGAAASILRENNMGTVIDLEIDNDDLELEMSKLLNMDNSKISSFAVATFSLNVISQTLFDVYNSVAEVNDS